MILKRNSNPFLFFSKKEKEAIVSAIRGAEQRTSGEIRVHLAEKIQGDILSAARRCFEQIGMARTQEKNGVLFFMVISSREFAVVGDQGIDARVPKDFWNGIARELEVHFSQDRFADGLMAGVRLAGKQLQQYFPRYSNDRNELLDQISFSLCM